MNVVAWVVVGLIAGCPKGRVKFMRMLECTVCSSIALLNGHPVTCSCGRSFARIQGAGVEARGPCRILLAVDVLLPDELEPRRTVSQDTTARRITLDRPP
jgi:hypothetical protein